jgi:CrcB protein
MMTAQTLAFLCVGAGGALGSMLRYAAYLAAAGFWPTLLVNALGSLLMGAAMALGWHLLEAAHPLRALFVVGVLGGFTTFSAFSGDVLALLQSGQYLGAALYALAMVVVCCALCAAGFYLMKVVVIA